MANDFLDSLGINITADTQQSINAITALIRSLEKLEKKTRAGGDFGLGILAQSLREFGNGIREYTKDVEAYGNLLAMMGVKASTASKNVSSSTRRAASDAKSSATTMQRSLDGVGDSIEILGKEAVDMGQKLKEALSASGGQNPLFTSITAGIVKLRSETSAFVNWMNRYTPTVPLISRRASSEVINQPSNLRLANQIQNIVPPWERANNQANEMREYLRDIVELSGRLGGSFKENAEQARRLKENTQLVPYYGAQNNQRTWRRSNGLKENDLFGSSASSAFARAWARISATIYDSKGNLKSFGKILKDLPAWAKALLAVLRIIGKVIRWEIKNFKAFMNKVSSTVSGVARKVSSEFKSLVSGGIKKAFSGVSSAFGKTTKALGKGFVENFTGIFKKVWTLGGGLLRRIGRISLYRIVREVLAKAFDNIYEGFENLYYWATVVGYKFGDAMDRIASASLLVRNSFAAMVEPLVTTVYPVIERIAARFAEIAALVSKFLAELLGRDSYVVAKAFSVTYKDSLEDVASGANGAAAAVDKYKNTLMGFDELNPLNDISERNPSGGGGGSGSGYSAADYAQMFEKQATDMGSWAARLGDAWRSADWSAVSEMIYTKINEAIDGWDSRAIAEKLGGKIQSGVTMALDILRNLHMITLGGKLADFFNGLTDSIVPEDLGALFAQKIKLAVKAAYGFVRKFEWEENGEWLAGVVNGWFAEGQLEAAGTTIRQAIKGLFDGISAFIDGLELDDIHQSILTFLGNAFDGQLLANKVNELMATMKEKSIPQKISEILVKIITEGIELASGINWGNVGTFMHDTASSLISALSTILDGITWSNLTSNWNNFWNGFNVRDLWSQFKDLLSKATGDLTFDDVVATVSSKLIDAILGISSSTSGLSKSIATHIANIKTKIAQALGYESWDNVKTVLSGALSNMLDEVLETIRGSKFISDAMFTIGYMFGEVGNEFVKGFIQGMAAQGAGWIASLFNAANAQLQYQNTDWSQSTYGSDGTETLPVIVGGGVSVPLTATITGINDNIPESQKTLPDFAASIKKKFNDMKADAYGVYGWLDYGSDIKTKYNSLSTDNYGAYGWLSYGANMTQTYNGMPKDNYGVFGWLAYGATLATKYLSLSKDSYGVYGWLSYGADMVKKYISLKKDSYGVYAWLSVGASIKKLWNAITSMWITKAGGGVFYGGQWHNVASYAQGGSPLSGQMFIAREEGPELVGTLGGHTAVMNNDQIVASVSAGVARAISNIEFHMNGAFGTPVYGGGFDEDTMYRAFLRALNDSEIGDINLDGDVLYRKMVNRNIHNTRMTGVNAFA